MEWHPIPKRGADKKQAEHLFMFAVRGEEVGHLGVCFRKKGTFQHMVHLYCMKT